MKQPKECNEKLEFKQEPEFMLEVRADGEVFYDGKKIDVEKELAIAFQEMVMNYDGKISKAVKKREEEIVEILKKIDVTPEDVEDIEPLNDLEMARHLLIQRLIESITKEK